MSIKSVSLIIATGIMILLLTACGTTQPEITPTESPTEAIPPPTATSKPWVHPSGRVHHNLVYLDQCGQILLLGGSIGDHQDPVNASNELWSYEFSTNTWKEMTPMTDPGSLTVFPVAFDGESSQLIQFGGAYSSNPKTWDMENAVNATWAYNCTNETWKEMSEGPSPRLGHQMVYNTTADRIILFGGVGSQGLKDTWAYDFNTDTWTEMDPATSPPRRYYHTMAYDVESDKVLVWGGNDLPDKNMWVYDLNTDTWEKKVSDGGPSHRNFAEMVYDTEADRIIFYGGFRMNDTWVYDYNTNSWTEMKPDQNPGVLERFAMVYDPSSGNTILFGGRDYDSDQFEYMDTTWVYDFNTNMWTNMTPK